jgi:hypothetical protein
MLKIAAEREVAQERLDSEIEISTFREVQSAKTAKAKVKRSSKAAKSKEGGEVANGAALQGDGMSDARMGGKIG